KARALTGNLAEAQTILDSSFYYFEKDRDAVLAAFVDVQTRAGDWNSAKETVREMDNRAARDEGFLAVARGQARARCWEQALATASDVEDDGCKKRAIAAIAAEQARDGERAAARDTLALTLISQSIDSDSLVPRIVQSLLDVIDTQARLRAWDDASETMR